MIRLVICNQRGGVSKTTTTHTIGRHLADHGLKVLMIDTDPQGSLGLVLGAKPKKYLYEFVVHNHAFEECVWHVSDNIDLLCSNRETTKAEVALLGMTAGELAFVRIFGMIEDPVRCGVDRRLAFHQPGADVFDHVCQAPADTGRHGHAEPAGRGGVHRDQQDAHGPVQGRDQSRRAAADHDRPAVQPDEPDPEGAGGMSEKYGIPVLPPIRTDGTVPKAERVRKFLLDMDPHCKAAEDYRVASAKLMELLNVKPRYNAQEEISA